MSDIRRVLSDPLGRLVDVPGNFMGVPGIVVRALLERGLRRYK